MKMIPHCCVLLCCVILECHAGTELLVKIAEGPSSAAARAADRAVGATPVRLFENVGWYQVRLPDGMTAQHGKTLYEAQPGVLKVEANSLVHHSIPTPASVSLQSSGTLSPLTLGPVKPNDPKYSAQWDMKKIGMETAWGISTGDTNIVVAIIDTGVNYLHPDLAENMWRNPGESGLDANGNDKATNGVDDDGDGYIDDVYGINTLDGTGDPIDRGFTREGIPNPYYHGTACAGIIAAVGNNRLGISGINWRAKIMAIDAMSGDQSLPTHRQSVAHVLAAFDYVLEMRRRGVNVRVVSNSYIVDIFNTAIYDTVAACEKAGILIVFAAGNDGHDADNTFWRYAFIDSPNIITVTGTDRNDQQIFDFGRTTTDLAAPAFEIQSLWTGTNYVTDFSGTSAACPHVAGAATLIWATKPDLTVNQVKAALFGSVDILSALGGKTRTNGRLNVGRALLSLDSSNALPMVLFSAPGNPRADQDAPIIVQFSEAMDHTSVEAGFSVNPPVAGTFLWTADDRGFTYSHSDPFLRTNYTLTIAGSAKSLFGLTLDGNFDRVAQDAPTDNYVWNFSFGVPNDELVNAQLIEGTAGSVRGNNQRAIEDIDEPNRLLQVDAGLVATLWYRWLAPSNGWWTFDLTQGNSANTTLGVFRGTNYDSFTEVTSNNNYGSVVQSRASFLAENSAIYSIVVGGDYSDDPINGDGSFTLRWYRTPAPIITSFVPPQASAGRTITLNGKNFTGATAVKFNGVPASFTTTNQNFVDVRLSVTVPSGASIGPISIETPHGNFTTASQFVTVPRLEVRLNSDGTVLISWPHDSGFTAEVSEDLKTGSAWNALLFSSNPTTDFVVTDSSKQQRFYRLIRR